MVARRRLKKAARHTAHLEHRARVPLSQARIEKDATHVEDDAKELDNESVTAEDAVKEEEGDDEADLEEERGRAKVRMAV